MKIQKIVLLALLFLISIPSISQIDRTVAFDSCFIYSREHPDSTFTYSSLFVGDGIFKFYNDSIVVNFSNKWECGKYLIELDNIEGKVYGSDFLWYYSGKDKYRGWGCVCAVILDSSDNIVSLELISEYANVNKRNFAKKTRAYSIVNSNKENTIQE